jgi:uncharacterized phage-associated protein
MADCFDVARYILNKIAPCTTMKLHKLIYYSQAWSLAWEGEPLFAEDFQAWSMGPVIPELFSKHHGVFKLDKDFFGEEDPSALTASQRETIDIILRDYGKYNSYELSDMTHQERPWREARCGVPPGDRSENIISKESMQDYYGGLLK